MPKKGKAAAKRQPPSVFRREEMWNRTVEITSVEAHVSTAWDEEDGGSLELRGTLNEAISGRREIRLNVYPEARRQLTTESAKVPLWVPIGVLQVRPDVTASVYCYYRTFARIWSLALAGRLKYAWLAFTKPHFTHASVTNATFSTRPDD